MQVFLKLHRDGDLLFRTGGAFGSVSIGFDGAGLSGKFGIQ